MSSGVAATCVRIDIRIYQMRFSVSERPSAIAPSMAMLLIPKRLEAMKDHRWWHQVHPVSREPWR
jgi:hypothetical protein